MNLIPFMQPFSKHPLYFIPALMLLTGVICSGIFGGVWGIVGTLFALGSFIWAVEFAITKTKKAPDHADQMEKIMLEQVAIANGRQAESDRKIALIEGCSVCVLELAADNTIAAIIGSISGLAIEEQENFIDVLGGCIPQSGKIEPIIQYIELLRSNVDQEILATLNPFAQKIEMYTSSGAITVTGNAQIRGTKLFLSLFEV